MSVELLEPHTTHRAPVDLKVDRGEAVALLQSLIRIPSISGSEAAFTQFVAKWANDHGLVIDLWQADEAELAEKYPLPTRHLALANRPTLVVRLPRDVRAKSSGRSVMFNAHADVVSAPHAEQWLRDPWSGDEVDGRIIGRGACDVKGPLASALLMMSALKRKFPEGLAGDVLLELIPGEEDCVGLGTLTSIARGHTADACIVLEPTDGQPRSASRGGVRFEIVCNGKAVHGTVKWLGRDAIGSARRVLDTLEALEVKWNDRAADPLFSNYAFARPITVDSIHGGEWQGMTCDRCVIAGYLELLPGDDLNEWSEKFLRELNLSETDVVRFLETYAGNSTPSDSALCESAERVAKKAFAANWTGWQAFNSGCEAGCRASVLGTPTLVWGPGSLNEAHAVNESILVEDVRKSAVVFGEFVGDFCGRFE